MGQLGGVNVIIFKKSLRNGAGRPGFNFCLSVTLSMGLNNSVSRRFFTRRRTGIQTGNAGEVLVQCLTSQAPSHCSC